MKYFTAILGLIIWSLLTLALTISLIGIIVIMVLDANDQYTDIPRELLKVFKS